MGIVDEWADAPNALDAPDAAERALLGSILFDPELLQLPQVAILRPNWFRAKERGAVFAAMVEDGPSPYMIDGVLLARKLEERLRPPAGLTWISALATLMTWANPDEPTVARYAEIIRAAHVSRRASALA